MRFVFFVSVISFAFFSLSQSSPTSDDDEYEDDIDTTVKPTIKKIGTRPTPSSSTPVSTTSRSDRISVQKCNEYKDEVLDKNGSKFTKNSDGVGEYSWKLYNCNPSLALISGGNITKPGEFPHMAAIGWRYRGSETFKCGGSLISYKFVLTVAHCTLEDGKEPNFVRLGEQNLAKGDDNANPKNYEIKHILRHESYVHYLILYDIALLELEERVTFTTFIRPACLSQTVDFRGKVMATGWGRNETYGYFTDDLMKVGLEAVGAKACHLADLDVSPQQICVVGQANKDTCEGDSGGPIQVSHDNAACVYDIVGLTSYGYEKCGAGNSLGNSYAVYTRVQAYIEWIEEKVWKQWD